MTRWLASLCLQRVLLPLGLLSASVLRQNGLSAIYLLLLLYNPVVPVPTSKTMGGHTGYYQKVVIFFTTLNIIAAFAFQIVLIAHPPYGSLVTPDCGFLERVFRFSGFVRLDGIDVWSAIRVVAPEVAMLVISIAVYASCLALNHPVSNRQDDPLLPMTDPPPPKPSPSEEAMRQRRLSLLTVLGKYVCLISMCFAGILRPSALSGVYYIVFLGSMTWWGCNRPLHKAFAFICRFLLVLVAGHIWALYLYQMQWAQELLPKDAPIARYLGLTALATTKCDDPRNCHLTDEEWASFVNPVALVWLYFILWYEANMIMSAPLIRGRESVYRRGTNSKRPIQDSIGVTTLSEVPEDSSQFENVAEEEEDAAPGILEIFVNASMTIAQLLTQSSYIGTIIIMMAWSITYHSWLTFVLLLWASIMWLMPNQRRAMLRSSPFLVLYAELLLLAQYIYGMNLTDEELPQTVQGLNLKQIGLEKITHLPVKPLLIKTLYTVMFWITLKQYNQEKWEARNQSTITGIAAPLQIGVGTATTVAGVEAQTKTNQLIQGIGHTVRSLMTKFWIWVVASILFAIGITGERITIFRIVYMALALIFILTFQLSWTIWRKMMYSFWLIVIIYSMLILVMMYTYQFDNFQTYWETYLHIPPTLQLDIGLERFETTQLFVGLLTPTFFVVITVIQLYYFHKDFLAISDIKSRGTSSVRPRVSEGSSGGVRSDSGEGDITSDLDRNDRLIHPKHSFHILQTFSNLRMHLGVMKIQEILGQAVELVWLFLELHMLKVIMLTIILLAIYDVCAMHLIFVLLAVISTTFGTNIQTMAVHATSVLVSILLLAKMIYQIQYIDHDHWNVTCPSDNTTYNSAEWIGFNKADADHSLPHLVKGYIGVILVVTLHSVVLMRQKYQRHLKGRSLARPLVMFPRVSYRELDKDITHCIKYLFNYGFYRFGVEISLMAVVALIGTRMDFYAVLYSFWLCILIIPKRAFLSKVWGVFTVFIVITIPVQYVLVVGLPPSLCITYPWEDSETMQRFQEWMFFPDPVHPPHAYKLLCDFIVLLFVCRQGVVFRIESRNGDTEYPGGTNKSITHEAEQPDFRNPTPDFISHIRSWLDVVKRVVLSAFIWVTLAIVFLAGTNRVNLFSLGYLIGAFIFLWQGNDFYLRPINVILRWWNYLISYNVVVILLKAMLQILGCIFIKDMKEHACWAVQLLGIACIKKFSDTTAARGVLDPIECSVPRGDVGLAWDGFCFGFLILQRRLFNSYYFFHIIDEAKAMAILASRGAELIEELSHKQILEQQEAERKILEKIKYKMDRIKASQQKVQVASYKEPSSHYVAIRSGDYYMFDDLDEELDLIYEHQADSAEDDTDDATSRPDVFKLLSSVLKTDIGQATAMAEESGERRSRSRSRSRSSAGETRRSSLPVIPRPSSVGSSVETAHRPPLDASQDLWRSCSSLPDSPEIESKPGPSGSRKKDDGSKRPDGFSPDGGDSKRDKPESISGEEEEEEEKDQSLASKIMTVLKFLWAFINSVMVTITKTLNRFSRDYRYVMKTLAIEKKQLKERSGFGVGIRTGGTNMWQPFPNMITKMKISPIQLDELEEDKELSAADQPPAVRLVLAIWFAIISHSELVCYFIIFLHQIRSPTLLSLPLPLMVFLWGTLTVPRPSKTFWVTIIAYTEVVVVFKCMFQFEILPWNQVAAPDNAPFFLPRIIGIERQPGMYAYYDLLLLLVVFFHRSMLKSLGLWKSSAYTGPLPVPSSSDAKSSVGGSGGDYESNGGPMGHPTDSEEARLVPKHGEMTAAGEWSHHQPNGDDPNSSPEYLASILPIKTAIYLNPFKSFFESLLKPSVRVTADVYAYMFFCDFFNFLVVIFGFASFGSQQGDGGVSQYFEENKVPVAFLVMLILQFGLIIVDRTLYLRKFILGKVIFQFILVIGIHIWMFFVLPAVTDRQFNSNLPPQMWYMVKCFYLLLSAYQIRSGYPTRILGNFLCKSYNYLNMFLFKVFMAVPFVFELRALMDWIWTDTSMTLSDWLKMEDIFAHIFQLKCQRRAETEYPQPRGQKKASLIKYIVGGGCLVGIIAVIWFPLVLFALGNTVGQPNLPYDVTVSVRIGAFQPVYSYSAQNNSIFTFNTRQWDDLGQLYKLSRVAQTFLSNYEYEDIGVVKLSSHSTSIWTISPPDNITLIEELQSNKSVTVKLEWIVSRKSTNPEQPGVATSSVEISLSSGDPSRQKLVSLLTGHASNQSVVLPNLLPKFLKITSRGTATPISQLMSHEDTPVKNPYRNLSASLNRTDESVWWELSEYCSDALYENLLKFLPYTDCDSLILYTFNDKAFPATLNIISGKGIIGLYTTFVIVIHSVIRGFFTGISFKIMFDDMPNVDRVLQLCLDIYLVRESGELDLEEDLFAKLVFLYRSPETLIKWTRPPEEEEGGGPGGQDDEGDNQAVRQ